MRKELNECYRRSFTHRLCVLQNAAQTNPCSHYKQNFCSDHAPLHAIINDKFGLKGMRIKNTLLSCNHGFATWVASEHDFEELDLTL